MQEHRKIDKMNKLLAIISVILLFTGCYYDNEEYLYPGNIDCDTTGITYQGTIKPVIDLQCKGCHNAQNASGNVNLDGHVNLLTHINSGKFYSSIVHDGKASPMPKGAPKLDNCKIKKIKIWIDRGAPDN